MRRFNKIGYYAARPKRAINANLSCLPRIYRLRRRAPVACSGIAGLRLAGAGRPADFVRHQPSPARQLQNWIASPGVPPYYSAASAKLPHSSSASVADCALSSATVPADTTPHRYTHQRPPAATRRDTRLPPVAAHGYRLRCFGKAGMPAV